MNERKELIERLRDATEGPRMLMGEAADMLEADAVPPGYGWLTACDEEMICYHLGVANLSDSYESAKRKLRALIDLNVAIATDPAVNGGMSLQPAVPQEPVAWYEYNADLDAWFLAYGHNPKAKTRPLVFGDAPHPQQPRLTDEEIEDFADASTGYSRMVDIKYFARAIEKKVRGEA